MVYQQTKGTSNKPYNLGDNLAKNLDGHRSRRIKRSECYDKPRSSLLYSVLARSDATLRKYTTKVVMCKRVTISLIFNLISEDHSLEETY